jgi:DNA-binding Lrp family transcriptional regulator
MPFLKISKKIGISPITVQKRFEKMKKNGAFFGTTIILDLSKIGFRGKTFLFITTTKCNMKKFVEDLKQITNCFLISEIVGNFDVLAMIAFRKTSEIKNIINEIRENPCVERIEIAITDDCLFPYKEDYTEIDPFKSESKIFQL